MNDLVLAVDVGGTQFRLALFAGDTIVARVRKETRRSEGAPWMIRQIIETGNKLIADAPAPVKACGVGFGGLLDFLAQRVIRSLHVPGWENVALPRLLTEAFGIPCIMDNDGTTAAVGEHRFGAGRGTQNMVYYTISTGIGGGIILDGCIYRGRRGYAGEVGHVPIVDDGDATCTCGKNGCLEAYGSGLSIARRAQQALREKGRNVMPGDAAITARDVFAAAPNDPLMQRVIDDTTRYLGASIAGLCNVLDPERVVLGGGVAQSGEPFIAAVRSDVHARLLHPGEDAPSIVASALGDDSVLWGAATLARDLLVGSETPSIATT